MPTLIHLNGAPGVGKSTLARRYVDERVGVLNCDVDQLRCLVGGWQEDFNGAGALVRPLALSMIRAHLDGGHDVVLPQMLAGEAERARFRAAAEDGGHAYLHVLLVAPVAVAASRFYGRTADPIHAVIRDVVDRDGGQASIERWDRQLQVTATSGDAILVEAASDVDTTYSSLIEAIGRRNGRR